LGENNVVEYPFKPLYHCFLQEGRLVGYDLEGNEVVKENTESGTLSYAYAGYPVPRIFGLLGSRQYECEEGFPEISNYDLIIVAFLRGSTPAIINKILHYPGKIPPIFFIDGEDDCLVRKIYRSQKVLKYFKREILIKKPPNITHYIIKPSITAILGNYKIESYAKIFFVAFDDLFKKMEPLNITIPDFGFRPIYDKIYDLCYVSNMTSPLRIKIMHALKKLVEKHKLNAFIHLGNRFGFGIPWLKYIELIACSKCSIAVPGAGFDTYRYWEIPYLGSCLVSWKPWIKIPDNFVDGENAVFFRSIDELKSRILHILKSDEWELIAEKGREHFLEFHTPEKRAKRILKEFYFGISF
jgi:hypothetical protein